MITVGLDFGTHQTKVCIERKERAELEYSFMKFEDSRGQLQYTLPSIISIQPDGRLRYGHIPADDQGTIIRYFKQAVFSGSYSSTMPHQDAMLYSIWYLAYILFDLEERYGQAFTVQMGAPTDSGHLSQVKKIAVQILSSAYGLVEELFANKQEFLNTPIDDLRFLTEVRPYSDYDKESFNILVFPEAYACLNPLVNQGKVSNGMSVMFDIGGGTTDISLFTIEGKTPQVYDFFSINQGLNFLTESDPSDNRRKDSNTAATDLKYYRIQDYQKRVNDEFNKLYQRIVTNYKRNTQLHIEKLKDALRHRPLIFCGGGSTFGQLRRSYAGFNEIRLISDREWNTTSVLDIEEIREKKLCPILSTAYGLSISRADDNIAMKPFGDLFADLRHYVEDTTHPMSKSYRRPSDFGHALGGFSYTDDWSAVK